MATKAYTIYSRYEPHEREVYMRETGQLVDEEDLWQTESSLTAHRRLLAPLFVPAGTHTDIHDGQEAITAVASEQDGGQDGEELAMWYMSLTNHGPGAHLDPPKLNPISLKAPIASAESPALTDYQGKKKENWSSTTAPQFTAASTSTPSLTHTSVRKTPMLPAPQMGPVYRPLGPSNKGFKMLQNIGWNEGEALGPHVARLLSPPREIHRNDNLRARDSLRINREDVEVNWDDDGEVVEIQKVDVIDLTFSDEDEEVSDEEDCSPSLNSSAIPARPNTPDSTPYARQALLTPIKAVPKSDRLGIGLKARPFDHHKALKKPTARQTAALIAHRKAAEELQKKKSEFGRGTRAFEREYKMGLASRTRLLAYMNA